MKKIVGIIAEYNPFHLGHQYQMKEAKRLSGADYVVALISGHFVQRGEPAIFDTYTRAKMALLSGADAVFEMPTPFSTSSAEDFANYGVSLFSSLGVQALSFGTEGASVEELERIANILVEESEDFKIILKELLVMGNTYPEARMSACVYELEKMGCGDVEIARAREILSSPNNILGIEYMKAKRRIRSPIEVFLVNRIGSGYHEREFSDGFASATAIRRHMFQQGDFGGLLDYVPKEIVEEYLQAYPISADDFTGMILRRVLQMIHEYEPLDQFLDVTPDLAQRIMHQITNFSSFADMVNAIKSRQFTFTRISRALMHIALGIKDRNMSEYKEGRYAPYARLLGFQTSGSDVLTQLKMTSSIPIISKMSNAGNIIHKDSPAFSLLMEEVHASEIYNSIYFDKYKRELPNIYTRQMIVI